jgi:hypothetical protein
MSAFPTPALALFRARGILLVKMADVVALIDAQEVPAVCGSYKKKTAQTSN